MLSLVVCPAALAFSLEQSKGWARDVVARWAPAAKQVRITCNLTDDLAVCALNWRAARWKYGGFVALTADEREVTYQLLASGRRASKGSGRSLLRQGKLSLPDQPGSRRDHPVPFGTTGHEQNWDVTVISTEPDATADVMAENRFNDPPEEGNQFYIATIRATYLGEGSQKFGGSYRLRSVGQTGVSYTTFDTTNCGVIPDPISDNEVFQNGSVQGNICWQIRSADAASLQMFDVGRLADSRTWFALTA